MAYLLVVDDDQEFAEAVVAVLQEDGHEVAMEHGPEGAMARLGEQLPDGIVLDVMFPENPSGGFELAREIRREHQDIPILMLTAVNQQFPLGFSSKDIDATWLPISEFVEKPVDLGLLREKVKELVS